MKIHRFSSTDPLTTLTTRLASGLGEVRVYALGVTESITAERHPRRHLLVPLRGECEVLADEGGVLGPGVVGDIKAGELYGLTSSEGCELLLLAFEEDEA